MGFNKEFLEDEVRLGFYIPSVIKQAWAAELEVLNVIDDICSKLGIEYFADWGTLLGAVRHHGFIPWDDDFDLVMRREDYDKFYNEAPALFPEGYSIHTFRNEEGFKEFHAVVVNAKTPNFDKEQYDRFHGFCYLCGIDIFILDYVHMDKKMEDERVKEALYLISLGDSIFDGELSSAEIKSSIEYAEKITHEKIKDIKDNKELAIRIYELADAKCAEVKREESDILTQMVPWGLKKQLFRRYPKTDYDSKIRVPFEYTLVPVPACYDKLLTQRYGDYMRIHKAWGAHEYPFFEKQVKDLEALLDFNLPKYKFNHEELLRKSAKNESWKELISEALANLENLNIKVKYEDSDETLDSICSAQELAIDMGNLIEQIKGENHNSIRLINDYCENLYHLYSMLTGEENPEEKIIILLEASFKELLNAISDLVNRKEVVFLPFKASAWDSFEDIYIGCLANENMDVYVIPIPYYYKEYDGTMSDEQYDLESYLGNLNVISYTEFSLELHHPNMIFIQNPYDEFNAVTSIHPHFYSRIIKEYTDKLVYVPWFKSCKIEIETDSRSYKNMDYYVTVPGVVNADYVIVDTEEERMAYIAKLNDWSREGIWQEKIFMRNEEILSKLDIAIDSKQELSSNKCKSIMYYIGAGQTFQNSDVFMNKFKDNIKLFEGKMESLSLVLVLDRMLEKTMMEYAPELWNEFENELELLKTKNNLRIMKDDIPKEELLKCDAFYGDSSFLACEYLVSGKPVMIQNYDV